MKRAILVMGLVGVIGAGVWAQQAQRRPESVAGSAAPEGFKDTPMIPGTKWHVHDPDRPLPPEVKPGEKFSHEAGAPSDAIVLFDGKDLSKWQGEKGEPKWKVENGYVETTKTGRLRTKDEFGDVQLHLE